MWENKEERVNNKQTHGELNMKIMANEKWGNTVEERKENDEIWKLEVNNE